jgi:uncharacterized protein (TIGR00255 family)
MALSMTGCGEGVASDGSSTCRVELRCVNNRFLKFSLRAREGFATLESRIEAAVRERVKRGTVQMTLDLTGPAAPAARQFDEAQLEAYLVQLEHFCARHDLPVPRGIDGLLSLPGILADGLPASDAMSAAWPLVARALDAALDRLDAMRRSEGDAMARDMRLSLQEIPSIAARIRDRVPAALAEHRTRLLERVGRLLEDRGATITEADLAREIAVLADRSDIAEELVRLESHVAQFDRLLDEDTPGRALDFLTQELAREANTVASKSADVAIAHAVVELKTQVERLKELVQNVE